MRNKSWLVTAIMVAGLSGCGDQSDSNESAEKATGSTKEASQPSNKDMNAASMQTAQADETLNAIQGELNALYEEAAQTLFKARQLSATAYGLSEEMAGKNYNALMESYTVEEEAKLRHALRQLSAKIAAVDSSALAPADKETQQVMSNIVRYYAGHEAFPFGYIDTWMGLSPFILNQINGPLIDTPRVLQNDHKINTKEDALSYLNRLEGYQSMIVSVQEKFIADAEKGWLPPKVVLKGALRYIRNFVESKPEAHSLYEYLSKNVQTLRGVTQEEKSMMLVQAKQLLANNIYPQMNELVDTIGKYYDKARDEHGIWAQPNGELYYQDAIRQLADSDLSADDIHAIGLSEVERITKAMDAILQSQGFKEGTVGERVIALTEMPEYLYEDSEAGRAKLLDDLNGYIAEINEKMPKLFKTKPPYDVEVKAFPKEVQDGAPGGQYSPPALDGSKPGIYWINLRDMKANPTFSLKTLTYHEANPGHHWQIALNLAQDDLPMLRRIAPYNAYVEGWALYSELVAKEMGMYENDPMGDLGRLQAELFRAVRLVVDTGLHHKRWTREQAIDYMAKTTGSAQSDVVAEIERYMAWPGQALGYKLGMIQIVEMREKAKEQLGEQFDLAEFHDLVLLGGAVPMKVLKQKVERWIEGKQK